MNSEKCFTVYQFLLIHCVICEDLAASEHFYQRHKQ
jgi:hypothetical protein